MSDDNLLDLLNDEVPEKKKKPERLPIPKKVRLSYDMALKAMTICKLVKEVSNEDYEWFSFLIASRSDRRYIAHDLLLVPGAEVQLGHVAIDGSLHAKAARKVEEDNRNNNTNNYIIGWLHSHGDNGVFHSEEDLENFRKLLNSVYHNTKKPVMACLDLVESNPIWRIRNDKIIMRGKNIHDAVITYHLGKEEEYRALLQRLGVQGQMKRRDLLQLVEGILRKTEMDVKEAKLVGFGYSVVVNNKAKADACLGVVEHSTITGTGNLEVSVDEADFEVYNDALPCLINKGELREQVKKLRFFRPVAPKVWAKWRKRPHLSKVASSAASTAATPVAQVSSTSKTVKPHSFPLPDLCGQFAFRAYEYVDRWWHADVNYTEYFSKVLDKLTTTASSNAFNKDLPWGLEWAVQQVGPIKMDKDLKEPPMNGLFIKMEKLRTSLIYRAVNAGISYDEMVFMEDFMYRPLYSLDESIKYFVRKCLSDKDETSCPEVSSQVFDQEDIAFGPFGNSDNQSD